MNGGSDPMTSMWADPTTTIVAPGFEVLAVCLACYAELRTWRPETVQAFRAWHRQRCGGGTA